MRSSSVLERAGVRLGVGHKRELRDPVRVWRAEWVMKLCRSRIAAPRRVENAEARVTRLIPRHGRRAEASVCVRGHEEGDGAARR
jgi:hypothetical protein